LRWLLACLAAWLPVAAAATTCADQTFDGFSFTVCDVTLGDDLRLFHANADGIFGTFSAVNQALGATGKALGFAMNAGMYSPERAPLGLYIEDGQEVTPLVTREGPGNFGLLPNGVFCIGDRFAVIETLAFASAPPPCRYATQSGPMLVIQGALHPAFLATSDSRNIRNGVGVSADGSHALFAISNEPVNFHTFARFFRDGLGLQDALYLDGSISRLYAPSLGRDDLGLPMGPIIGTVVPKG
jgi:uncharacterized protein YigE (DUF2233 family)